MGENLIWIDMEMTGLDHEYGVILEIATVVTDDALEVVAEGPNLAIHHSDKVMADMETWSRDHHQASGLLDRAKESAIDNDTAESMTLEFVAQHCREGKSPLCGNTIWQDRRFLIKHMPRLEAFLHYRVIDVSSINSWAPKTSAMRDTIVMANCAAGPCLALSNSRSRWLSLSDIMESIGELKYYRKKVFIPNL